MDAIHQFIVKRLRARGDEKPLEDEESLFVSGRLDSLDAMDTVLFLEQEFGLNLSELVFSLDLIDTVDKIRSLSFSGGKL
jgi:acyl carrier protein